jgi:hypothetical protein
MKHNLNSHPQWLNEVKPIQNGGKEKRKTVHIKLHPKPNAPRYSTSKPARGQLQPH